MSVKDQSTQHTEELTYRSAMGELDSILADLDGDDVDIDALTSQVKRAAELIDFCRGRISSAKVQVEQVVANLSGHEDDEH